MYRLKHMILPGMMALAFSGNAHTVLLSEDFNNDYTENFPLMFDLDHQPPIETFRTLFLDTEGVARPWWHLKDAAASKERFLASHSAYRTPAKSNDWVVSRPLDIPTEGFVLTFDAQSLQVRQGERLSDLWVYISETPITADNLPQEPTLHLEQVSEGRFPEEIENDFEHFSLNLDDYAGKRIWIAFANLNEDRDILAIDNVLVQRLDNAELTGEAPEYSVDTYKVAGQYAATTDITLKNWKLTFSDGVTTKELSGEELLPGTRCDYSFEAPVKADQALSWTVTFESEGEQPIVIGGNVNGLAFLPWHRVLLEEATGTWCGNCPLGMYTLEQMALDQEMKEYVVPVSVHIPGSGPVPDPMINENYAYMFGVSSAPALRIDRDTFVTYFSTTHDVNGIDLENPLSVAYAVKNRHNEVALMDLDLKGDFVIEGTDTLSINATVTLRPAMTLPSERLGVGFILVENNVGLDNSLFWMQENYTSGANIESRLDGLTELPKRISNWKFQDVARQVYGFRGNEEVVLPAELPVGVEQQATVNLVIPETYADTDDGKGGRVMTSESIVAANTVIIAYVLDLETGRVMNCASFPMSEQAEKRLTIARQVEIYKNSGVYEVSDVMPDEEMRYFNLQGMPVSNPEKGNIYILSNGKKIRF